MNDLRRKRPWWRGLLRWGIRIAVALIIVMGGLFLYVFHTALYHRYSLFPKQAAAIANLQRERTPVLRSDDWTEYRGVCHSHSLFSHDSEVPFPDILAAAKKSDIQFIFMTDHCTGGKGDYSIQWKGLHDGVLFVRGFEMDYGFMPWGLPDDTVLANATEAHVLAKQIHEKGGYLFFAHSEEERYWDLPELSGMEIYNIHTNLKTRYPGGKGYAILAPDMILNTGAYPELVMRLIYEPQTKILAHWDELNATRKLTGIAGNDCHQNNGLRGIYTENGTFQLRETSPNTIGEWKLNALTRLLLGTCFGPLTPGKQLFRVDFDTYDRSLRFVNTHILARNLSEKDLLESLAQGRVFVAFDMLADARGFDFAARGNGHTAVMGESIPLCEGLQLMGMSPLPCRFTLVRNGKTVEQVNGRSYTYTVKEVGKYRLEAELDIAGAWTPWVYTNPIEVQAGTPSTPAGS